MDMRWLGHWYNNPFTTKRGKVWTRNLLVYIQMLTTDHEETCYVLTFLCLNNAYMSMFYLEVPMFCFISATVCVYAYLLPVIPSVGSMRAKKVTW